MFEKKKVIVFLLLLGLLVCWNAPGALAQQIAMPGKSIPKYVDLISPAAGSNLGVFDATAGGSFTVTMDEAPANILPTGFKLPNGLTYAGTWTWQYSIAGTSYPNNIRDTFLGPIVLTQRNIPVTITYLNNLGLASASSVLFYGSSVDQTLHWADPLGCMMNPACAFQNYTGPIPAVVHVHGGEVPSDFDGGPDQWFTQSGIKGPSYRTDKNFAIPANGAVYTYPNGQEAAPIWFHDHTLGATRLGVYAGLAGGYLITDPVNTPANLPAPVPIVIQDRIFDTNGQLLFPNLGINPTIHPFWIPEFFGDVIVVNGKSWPKMQVDPKRYRFIFIEGSNARFYNVRLMNRVTMAAGPPIWVIGTDGGYLDTPVTTPRLLMAPGERYEVIVDFSGFAGQALTLINSAKAPFPKGAPADPATVGQIMMFVVSNAIVNDTTCNPALGGCSRPTPIKRLVNTATGTLVGTASQTRKLTLNEVMGMGGPLEVLVNNTKWDGALSPNAGGITEMPRVGSTELWEIINLTADAHPIHLHLLQFQLMNRQPFNVSGYLKTYNALFTGTAPSAPLLPGCVAGQYCPAYGPPKPYNFYTNPANIPVGATPWFGGNPDVTPFLQDGISLPLPNEAGWKDTVIMYPGEVTRIAVRWAPQDLPATGTPCNPPTTTTNCVPQPGQNLYPIDPTGLTQYAFDANGVLANGPGYVWHCHIVDHEDNEMMRPYMVSP